MKYDPNLLYLNEWSQEKGLNASVSF